LSACLWVGLITLSGPTFAAETTLEGGWQNPPNEARLHAYWWWLNGNVTKASITHDLEEMKAKGFGGAVMMDANGAEQRGNDNVPHGPTFFTPAWRQLYKHTLREADRLGLEISLNIQSGWNLGGPIVSADDATKKLTWSELRFTGPTNFNAALPVPNKRDNYYRDIAVVAFRIRADQAEHQPLKNWREKALVKALEPFSAPKTGPLFDELPATANEEDARVTDVIDLTTNLAADGILRWGAPAGDWQIIRFGSTIGDHAFVSTCSEGWNGYALDVYDAGAFQRYWDAVVEPLIADAGSLTGKSLKYLHTDSWEVEAVNWTPTLRAEFKKRHGYDLLSWLPVITGRIVNNREESDRFLSDFRSTFGALAIDNHYRLFRDNAHKHGLLIHPESGGPHAVPIDAQRCLGWNDVPMSEFWAWSWEHRIGDENRFFVKQPASAAHTYGRKYIFAEGFTDIGPHWQESLWSNLKPAFDKALCEGMNVLVWHAFVCSPDEMGIPGQQYFAGTHLNPKVTWWKKSAPFFNYINRCQWLLQQGLFVADVAYYYGDHIPNFTQLKKSDPAKILPGYDYDVITAEALITRASVHDGRIVLPDGMNYRVLVLPEREVISLPVLQKLAELVAAGATVIGPKPVKSQTLQNYPGEDAEIAAIANPLWAGQTGAGRVIAGKTAREVLLADGVSPDFEVQAVDGAGAGAFDYFHRCDGSTEIYFVASRTNVAATATMVFRVTGKAPELWDAVTGEHHFVAAKADQNGRTSVALEFAPYGSWFVIFRSPANVAVDQAVVTSPLTPLVDITGPWTVHFDPLWAGPQSATFEQLVSWTQRTEPGIKYYSGTAAYENTFKIPAEKLAEKSTRFVLDLGDVHELAEVKVNGKVCGVTWCPPFRVDVTKAVKSGENKLRIEVVNFWPNRIIGDDALPPAQRLTKTNIRRLTKDSALMDSGLLGPVQLLEGVK